MAKVYENVLDLIGDTPLLKLGALPGPECADVYAKLEFFNPGFSVKDRTCLGMVEAAEAAGTLKPGATIVEPTAGNTGVGLALIGVQKGYQVICVMPEKFRGEKSILIQALGGKVEWVPTEAGIARAIERVGEILAEDPNAVTMAQFTNPANWGIHESTTGPEIFEQLDGKVDAIVAGAGTGGTFTGIARFMKEKSPDTLRVLVQPEGSVFDGGEAKPYRVEGIGGSFVPDTLHLDLANRIETIPDREIFATVRELARKEGMLVGGSSGAICAAALRVAKDLGPGKRVACIFPDAAERYMSKFQFGEDEV
jgi:cysteine synthase